MTFLSCIFDELIVGNSRQAFYLYQELHRESDCFLVLNVLFSVLHIHDTIRRLGKIISFNLTLNCAYFHIFILLTKGNM